MPITVRDGAITLKGSYRMGDEEIFSKNLLTSLFNDDLSNEREDSTFKSAAGPLSFILIY